MADPPSRIDGPTGDVRLQVAAFDLEERIPLDIGFVFEEVDCGASDLSRIAVATSASGEIPFRGMLTSQADSFIAWKSSVLSMPRVSVVLETWIVINLIPRAALPVDELATQKGKHWLAHSPERGTVEIDADAQTEAIEAEVSR